MGFGEYLGAGAAITKGLWRFNSNVTADSSGNGRTLTNVASGVSFTYLGAFGGGADFGNTSNNSKWLEYTSTIGIDLSAGATISFLVTIKSQPTLANSRFIDFRTGNRYMLINYQYSGGVYSLILNCNGTNVTLNTQLNLNERYLITAVTYSNGTTAFYLNAKLIGNGTMAATSVDNSITIGNCRYSTNFNCGAIYDEVIAEARSLSQIDTQKYYTYTKGWF